MNRGKKMKKQKDKNIIVIHNDIELLEYLADPWRHEYDSRKLKFSKEMINNCIFKPIERKGKK